MREYLTKAPIPYPSITEAEFLFAETFQGMLDQDINFIDPGTRAYKTPELPFLGNYCVKCILNAADVGEGEGANISRSLFVRRAPKMSAAMYVAYEADSKESIAFLAYWIGNKDSVKTYGFEFGINLKTLEVVVMDEAGNWQVLGIARLGYEKYYYLIEAIFDTNTGKYISIKVGDQVFDASAISAYFYDWFDEVGAISCVLEAQEAACEGKAYFGAVIVRQIVI